MRVEGGTKFYSNLVDSGDSSKPSLLNESVFPICIILPVSLEDGIWACEKRWATGREGGPWSCAVPLL